MSRIKLALLLSSLILLSCEEDTDDISDVDFKSLMIESLISITSQYQIDPDTVVHFEIYPDRIKSITIENILSENDDLSEQNKELLIMLNKNVDDSVKLDISLRVDDFYFESRPEKVERIMNTQNYFGLINLIYPAIVEDRGIFYLAIQCGNDCGGGYMVFFDLKDNGFQVTEIIQVWD